MGALRHSRFRLAAALLALTGCGGQTGDEGLSEDSPPVPPDTVFDPEMCDVSEFVGDETVPRNYECIQLPPPAAMGGDGEPSAPEPPASPSPSAEPVATEEIRPTSDGGTGVASQDYECVCDGQPVTIESVMSCEQALMEACQVVLQ